MCEKEETIYQFRTKDRGTLVIEFTNKDFALKWWENTKEINEERAKILSLFKVTTKVVFTPVDLN